MYTYEKKKKIARSIAWIIISAAFLSVLGDSYVIRRFWFLLRTGRLFDLNYLTMMFRYDPEEMIFFAVGIVLVLVLVLNVLGLIRTLLSLGNARTPEEAGRAGQTVRTERTVKTGRTVNAGRRRDAAKTDRGDTISYTYKTGRERYKEQFDQFLRDGVITKEEHRELCRKLDESKFRE